MMDDLLHRMLEPDPVVNEESAILIRKKKRAASVYTEDVVWTQALKDQPGSGDLNDTEGWRQRVEYWSNLMLKGELRHFDPSMEMHSIAVAGWQKAIANQ